MSARPSKGDLLDADEYHADLSDAQVISGRGS
jgi:hypothetical protein